MLRARNNQYTILPVNDEIIYVSLLLCEETVMPSPQTNPVIAPWTTSQAQLMLYEYLEKLGSHVLYCNTDSCIYVSRSEPSEYEPRTENFLVRQTNSRTMDSFIELFGYR